MKNIVKEIGPILAGFQLASYLVGFFSIGAFANWVLNSWRPFTHWLWDTFFEWLNFPDITDLEKDALTAVVFFLPMFLWSIYLRFVKKEKGPFSNFTKLFAFISAIVFLYLVAGSLIIETFQISLETLRQDDAKAGIQTLLSSSIIFTFVSAILLLISSALAVILSMRVKLENSEKVFHPDLESTETFWVKYIKYIEELSSFPILQKRGLTRKAFSGSFIFTSVLALLSISIVSGLFANIGWVRGISILLVVLSIYFTLRFDPRRLLVTTGAFLAFIVTSVCFEIVLFILDAMKKIPT